MRSATIMCVAAMGFGEVLASSAHANLHRAAHQKKDVDYSNVDYSGTDFKDMDWDGMGINWSTVVGNAGSKPTSNPSSSSNAAPVAPVVNAVSGSKSSSATSSSSSSSSAAGDLWGQASQLWKQLEGVSNARKSFGGQTQPSGSEVSYIGNHGLPYGSNAMLVDSTSGYDYTITVKNTQSSGITVNMWNKAGSDGQPNSGATAAPKDTTLTFYIGAGDSTIIALDENSQVALCEATDNLHSSGAFAQTWAEINMVKTGPAYDVSAILNEGGTYKMSITAEECSCTSSETQNSWVTETQTIGSGDCWINGQAAHLLVTMSGK